MTSNSDAAELENYSEIMPNYSYTGHDAVTIPLFLIRHAPKVTVLNLSHNRLGDLSGLEKFVNLNELNLDNNLIDDNTEFPEVPLHSLTVNNNLIKNLYFLLEKLSKSFPSLKYLSLLGNEACPSDLINPRHTKKDYHQYRSLVAYFLPSLKFLDFQQVTSEEQIRGYHLSVKPNTSTAATCDANQLAEECDNANRKVLLGRLRYTYTGKHSEGNRFISNGDL